MDTASATAVTGGFPDRVFDAQAVFRLVMDAFARPGTIGDLSGRVEPPSGLVPGAAAILAALCDPDAPAFLEAPDERAAAWIAFHTGAAVLAEPEGAAFAVLSEGSAPAGWGRFAIGTHDYPDRSTTLLLPVAALEGGAPLALTGPGIETRHTIAPTGLPSGFCAARRANAGLFPRGHDLVLVAGTRILALPRTTRVEEL